jgi:DNA-binding MarR family transcriptional regulator
MVERSASPPVAQLLHTALQRADSVFAQSVGRYALTRSQFAVLNAVKQSGSGGTQSALVEATGIDRSSIADLVGRLVKRGWLQRRPAEHDKRAYSVQLTQKGAAV